MQSPLKHQSRTIACFNDKSGFALGSIEGRVAIHHVEDRDNQ
jgi:mRNA export factor